MTIKYLIYFIVFPFGLYMLFSASINISGGDCASELAMTQSGFGLSRVNTTGGTFSSWKKAFDPIDCEKSRQLRKKLKEIDHQDKEDPRCLDKSISMVNNTLDNYSQNVVSSLKGLSSFMITYCSTKHLLKEKTCQEYESLKCSSSSSSSSKDTHNPKCPALAFQKYRAIFKSKVCRAGIISRLSKGNNLFTRTNSQGWTPSIKNILNTITIGLLSFLMLFLSYKVQIEACIYDNKQVTVADYSVKIIGLPKKLKNFNSQNQTDNSKKLEDIVKQKIENSTGYKITQVNMCYDIKEFLDTKKKYIKLKEAYDKALNLKNRSIKISNKSSSSSSVLSPEYIAKFKALDTKMIKMQSKFDHEYPEKMEGSAIISFDTEPSSEEFTDSNNLSGVLYNLFGLFPSRTGGIKVESQEYGNFTIYAEKAPEPKDIIWLNQGYSRFEITLRTCISYGLATLFLITGFLIISFLKVLAAEFKENKLQKGVDNILFDKIITFSLSGLISVTDILVKKIMHQLVNFMKLGTITENKIAIAKLVWKILFLTNAVIPLIISYVTFNFFGSGGLIDTMNALFLQQIFLKPIIKIVVDVGFYKRHYLIRKVRECAYLGKLPPINQREALEVYERPAYKIADAYADMLKNFALGLFYMPIMPISILYTAIIMSIWFWVEKVSSTTSLNLTVLVYSDQEIFKNDFLQQTNLQKIDSRTRILYSYPHSKLSLYTLY